MIKPKANRDTPEVVPPINCNDSSASAGMGRAKPEKIAPIIGARTKGFLNTFSTKNRILVLTSEAPSISRIDKAIIK